jgi:CRISPR system Cascade subunit CasB
MADAYPFPQGKPGHPSIAVLREWWHSLEQEKGERAVLRRAGSLTEVMLSPAFHRLLNELRKAGYGVSESHYPKLAAIAGLAARLKGIDGPSLGEKCGTGRKSAKKPDVAELRMRLILACDDIEELYTLLRRALGLLDDQANLDDLASTVWNWKRLDEKHPRDPRRKLALDYYAASPL